MLMLVLLLCVGASAAGVCVSVLVLNAGTCAGAGAAGVRAGAGDAGTGAGAGAAGVRASSEAAGAKLNPKPEPKRGAMGAGKSMAVAARTYLRQPASWW